MKTTRKEQSVTERTSSKAVPTPTFSTSKQDQETQQTKPETMQQLQDRLRDCFIQYKETA